MVTRPSMINSGRFLKLKPNSATRRLKIYSCKFQFPQDRGRTGDHLTGEKKRDLVSSVICSGDGPYCISMISISSTIDLKTLVGIRERCRANVPTSFNFRKGSSPTNSEMSSYLTLANLTFRPSSGKYVSQEPNGSKR